MAVSSQADSRDEAARLEAAVDSAIATCDDDLRATIRALILANEFLELEIETKVSAGYVRGLKHGRVKCYNG